MLTAKHHWFIYPFFKWYTKRKMKSSFASVQLLGKVESFTKPVLVLSNHVSWWDGFWLMYLNLNLLHKKFHFMMLEDQLKKFWFFNHSGGFSVRKNSKSLLETLTYSEHLLKESDNMVLIFPQGEIQSQHQTKIEFRKGVLRLIKSTHSTFDTLFVVNLLDYWSNPKPHLTIYFKKYESSAELGPEEAYQAFYNECLNHQITQIHL